MIHFDKIVEPPEFDERARKPGLKWLEENPDKRPKNYWSPFKPDLSDGFGRLCAYSVMFEPVGTIDHYISVSRNKMLAYEWSNYRFASAWLNSSKKAEDDKILDPFEVQDDWFEILLPSLQLIVTNHIPDEYREKAEYTVKRLRLRDDERIIRQRREWYRMYRDGEVNLEGLKKKAPLIARAIEKTNGSQKHCQ